MKKRSDGRYAKQVTIGHKDGKPIRKTVYGYTTKELDKNYRELMMLVDRGTISKSVDITLNELINEWYRIKLKGTINTNTEAAYASILKRIRAELGEYKVKKITIYTIESYLNKIKDEGYISLANRSLSMLRKIMAYGIEIDVITKNPCTSFGVKYKKKERRKLTQNEIDIINNKVNFYSLGKKELMLLYLLRYTGMRRSELFALQKKDIDLANMVININKTVIDNDGKPYIQDNTKTKAGDRICPILTPLADVLIKYIDPLHSEDYLFLNRSGNLYAVNSMRWMFTQIKEKLGLGADLTMHSFRYNFVSECYDAKIDIKRVQEWVGHVDVSTTMNIYTKLSNEQKSYFHDLDAFHINKQTVKPQSNDVTTNS